MVHSMSTASSAPLPASSAPLPASVAPVESTSSTAATSIDSIITESTNLLDRLFIEMNDLGFFHPIIVLAGILWVSRRFGMVEVWYKRYKEVSAELIVARREVEEAKLVAFKAIRKAEQEAEDVKVEASKAIAAANEKVDEAKLEAKKEAADARRSAYESNLATNKVITEISKYAAMIAELTALKSELQGLQEKLSRDDIHSKGKEDAVGRSRFN